MNEPPEPPPLIEGNSGGDAPYFRGLTCTNCGEPNAGTARYCRRCGKSLQSTPSGSKVALILLFVFLGVPGLCLGGCFAMAGASALLQPGGRGPGLQLGLDFLLVGLVGLAVFSLTLYYAFLRKKK